MMPQRLPGLLLSVLALTLFANASAETTADHRAWQHGVNLLQVGNRMLVVWGSAGNPPRPNPGGDWPHDIYYAWLNPEELSLPAAQNVRGAASIVPQVLTLDAASIVPQVLVTRPEAQEPPSAAINSRGTIMVTSEDGNGGINQHAGLWGSALQELRKYPFTIKRGGHSGHVASMQDRFLVAYSEGWVNGGGWRDLGTGKNVFARIVGNDGKSGPEIKLTPDRNSEPRDSWPLVAGSDRNWLVIWQRFPGLTLQSALIDQSGKVIKQNRIIGGLALRYTYNVEFAPQLSSFVVAGTSDGSGFVSLISLIGEITRTRLGLPPMASESRMALTWDGTRVIGAYPVQPRGIAVVHLSATAIELVKIIDHPYVWDYAGTAAAFVGPDRVLFATLSPAGLRLIPVNLGD